MAVMSANAHTPLTCSDVLAASIASRIAAARHTGSRDIAGFDHQLLSRSPPITSHVGKQHH
jgi:hypothetical protein